MAAEIKPVDHQNAVNPLSMKKIELLSKIEGHAGDVNMAVLIPGREDGVISACDDRTVRIWLKRDTGNYWPSVCHCVPAPASCLYYCAETRHLFVGLGNGTIMEFLVAEDFNKISHVRDYLAHQDRVLSVLFSNLHNWILSCSRDKYFQWHCTSTGRRLGGYLATSWTNCLQFDPLSQYVFVGDYSGQISVLKINNTAFELISVLKGHSGSVRSLAWDIERRHLFSAGADNIVIVWDIGGQKGTALELSGHQDAVESVLYVPAFKRLISGGNDCSMIFWGMDVQRQETPDWVDSNKCLICGSPFFWNVRTMWENRTIGLRQHHCRKCGKAICGKCSQNTSVLPLFGYEYPVRICSSCHSSITTEDQVPLAFFHDSRHKIVFMNIDLQKKLLLTIGKDRLIKIWDVGDVLK